jgi:small-conductance mechanosensitive channel
MQALESLKESMYLGNSLYAYVMALGASAFILIALLAVKALFVNRLSAWAEKTATDLDDAIVKFVKDAKTIVLLIIALYAGLHSLDLAASTEKIAKVVLVLAVFLQFIVWSNDLIEIFIQKFVRRGRSDPSVSTGLPVIRFIGRIIFYSVLFVLALDNLGFNVSAIIAGLGVGGIAVALALQNVLSDLLASLSIVLDKPFVVGDFIIVGDDMGVVENIGLKTTRVRSLSGEQLIFANGDLLGSRIRNYKRMQERRILFTLGVTYQTTGEKLKRVPEIIREIIEKQPKARFDRSHFKEFADSSLNFETVMYIQSPEYLDYIDTHQAINFEIYTAFEKEGIDFAYPTQTLFVEKTGAA